jgi:hypothetical protein
LRRDNNDPWEFSSNDFQGTAPETKPAAQNNGGGTSWEQGAVFQGLDLSPMHNQKLPNLSMQAQQQHFSRSKSGRPFLAGLSLPSPHNGSEHPAQISQVEANDFGMNLCGAKDDVDFDSSGPPPDMTLDRPHGFLTYLLQPPTPRNVTPLRDTKSFQTFNH